jgi:hypothetical protein
MSIRALNWAIDVCARMDAPPKCRIVLFVIASHHHDKTGACFPSYDTIAEKTGYRRRGVIDIVAEIEANGLLIRQKRRSDGHQSSNQFVLFGRPAGAKWDVSRVQKKAPCESADGGTLPRVRTGAPDRDWLYKGEAPAKNLRVLTGGRFDV